MRYHVALLLSLLTVAMARERPPCVFCEIAAGELEGSFVFRDKKLMAFMTIAPQNPGHLHVVPVEHFENLADLPAETAKEMMALAQKIGGAIQRTDLKADALQLKMNSGRPVQGIMHAHLHVVPRFEGDAGERRSFELPNPPRAELDAVAKKIKRSFDLEELFSNYYEERLKLFPWEATVAGDPRYNDYYPNWFTESHRAKLKDFFQKQLAALRSVERDALSNAEQVSHDTLVWECEMNLAQLEFPTHLLPINQISSFHLFVAVWAGGTSAQPFKTVRDYENWLKRLDSFIDLCGSAVENMRQGMTTGHVLPKRLTEKVIPQLLKLAVGPAENHLFHAPIRAMPPEFSEANRDRLSRAYLEIIAGKIIPAFATLHAFMVAEYLPASRTSSGISEIPRGREYYDLQIKSYTTTDLTADEVFELGQKEVKRILAEMEKIKQQVGFQGSIREFFDHVRAKKELMPFTDPQQVIDNFKQIHRKMQPALERLFNLEPKTAFEIRRTEAFREKSAAAQYMAGPLDGSRPGIFYVPIPEVAEYHVASDEALFLHEAVPGHHYQISLQREDTSLPRFRRILTYSAYAEGWALYCESLGRELGLYDDPYQYFGMLSMEMHRAIRLVVDTGLHAKGWTREQAIAYSLAHEAEPESSVISEIERYMAWPGQALSYKIGQLKIRELRARAEEKLGENFDIRAFHEVVLKTGSVPLKVLENRIDGWIKSRTEASN
jgi:uncharacterized protein (DUF885 family)